MWITRFILIAFFLGLAGCAEQSEYAPRQSALPSATTLQAPKLVTSDDPLMLLYQAGDRRLSTTRLDVAVWSDGRIVWRRGDDLLESRVATHNVDDLLQQLHREGVFGDGNVDVFYAGPSANVEVIEINLPDRRIRLSSWHDLFEQNQNLIATSRGIEPLNGRNRDNVLAREPKEYRRFRHLWADIRSTVESWLPLDGEPYTGDIPIGK
jgi:hypothetical protein